jgi:hypothetical protein
MNKTLKTIGWILVALGILGILLDAGALVFGHRLAANRQAVIQQWKGNDDQPQFNPPQNDGQRNFAPRDGSMPRLGSRGGFYNRGGMMRGRPGGFFFLPVFFFALGPVMAIVGAVILLVNRPPKEKKEKKEAPKEKGKETKQSKSKK